MGLPSVRLDRRAAEKSLILRAAYRAWVLGAILTIKFQTIASANPCVIGSPGHVQYVYVAGGHCDNRCESNRRTAGCQLAIRHTPSATITIHAPAYPRSAFLGTERARAIAQHRQRTSRTAALPAATAEGIDGRGGRASQHRCCPFQHSSRSFCLPVGRRLGGGWTSRATRA